MHDSALSQMLWQFIITPARAEESGQLRECLIARQADVLDILLRSAEAENCLLAACAIVRLDRSQAELALPVLIEGLKSQSRRQGVCRRRLPRIGLARLFGRAGVD